MEAAAGAEALPRPEPRMLARLRTPCIMSQSDPGPLRVQSATPSVRGRHQQQRRDRPATAVQLAPLEPSTWDRLSMPKGQPAATSSVPSEQHLCITEQLDSAEHKLCMHWRARRTADTLGHRPLESLALSLQATIDGRQGMISTRQHARATVLLRQSRRLHQVLLQDARGCDNATASAPELASAQLSPVTGPPSPPRFLSGPTLSSAPCHLPPSAGKLTVSVLRATDLLCPAPWWLDIPTDGHVAGTVSFAGMQKEIQLCSQMTGNHEQNEWHINQVVEFAVLAPSLLDHATCEVTVELQHKPENEQHQARLLGTAAIPLIDWNTLNNETHLDLQLVDPQQSVCPSLLQQRGTDNADRCLKKRLCRNQPAVTETNGLYGTVKLALNYTQHPVKTDTWSELTPKTGTVASPMMLAPLRSPPERATATTSRAGNTKPTPPLNEDERLQLALAAAEQIVGGVVKTQVAEACNPDLKTAEAEVQTAVRRWEREAECSEQQAKQAEKPLRGKQLGRKKLQHDIVQRNPMMSSLPVMTDSTGSMVLSRDELMRESQDFETSNEAVNWQKLAKMSLSKCRPGKTKEESMRAEANDWKLGRTVLTASGQTRAVFSARSHDRIVAADRIEALRLLVETVGRTPVLCDLPPFARLSLVTKMQLKTVNGGETVFEAGDKADAMYVVKEGLLTVSTSGRPETRLSEGETFGEAALFAAKGVRSSTVRAQIQSVLWELTADAYKTVPLHHSTRSVATKWMIRAKTKQSSTSTAALSGAHDGIVVDTVA